LRRGATAPIYARPPPRGAYTIKRQTNVTGQTPFAGGRERPSPRPTFRTSPNRRRLYARAAVWTVWLCGAVVLLPRFLL
jgi:hypothetical protein